ncbi:MAG: diaminobutyrate--2-oxoglutarate transaminase [Pseudomonadota bacterium]
MNAPERAMDLATQLRRSHTGLEALYCLDSTPMLERQSRQESNARSYPRRIPLVLERASGIYVQDSRGQVFVDCLAGAGTLALGHNHPVVLEAIHGAMSANLPMHTLDLTTPVKDAFVQEIFDSLPPAFAKQARIQFCGPTGADAVEASLKLARTTSGRQNVLAFQGAYHGMTLGTLSISGNLGPKNALGGLLSGVQMLPYPHHYRCPFGTGGEAAIDLNLHYIEQLLADPESGITAPGAMILEPVQGEGGVIAAPDRWLRGLRRITEERGIALIVDEIQCGIARTGKMFAFEHAGIVPDIMPLSKAIGGGLPLAVVLYREELDLWQPGAHAGTFRGNQLAMAAGTATLRYLKRHAVAEHAQQMGERLRAHLLKLQSAFDWIGDVRGRGLMLGMEIVERGGAPDGQGHPPVHTARAKQFQQACLQRGLILELGGRHSATVRLLPPLIITEAEIDFVASILFAAATAI